MYKSLNIVLLFLKCKNKREFIYYFAYSIIVKNLILMMHYKSSILNFIMQKKTSWSFKGGVISTISRSPSRREYRSVGSDLTSSNYLEVIYEQLECFKDGYDELLGSL